MPKTWTTMLLTFGITAGLAHAMGMRHMHKHMIQGCAEGQQATVTCACGTTPNGQPMLCHKGQWCHSYANACTQ